MDQLSWHWLTGCRNRYRQHRREWLATKRAGLDAGAMLALAVEWRGEYMRALRP